MKQRNIMAVIIFSIITLGIYDLFWLARVKKDLNQRTDIHVPSMWLLFAPVLLFFGGLVFIVILSLINEGNSNTAVNLLGLLFSFVSIALLLPVAFYWTFKFSKAVNHYTSEELGTAITFILLWVLRFIGLAVIQDKFNDMLAAGVPGGASPAVSAPSFGAAPQPTLQPSIPAQHSPVDPTQPQSYEQQMPSNPSQRPPAGPNGPVVQ